MGGGHGMMGWGAHQGMVAVYPPQLVLRFATEVGVDDATVAKIRKLYFAAQAKMHGHRARAQSAKLEVARLMSEPKIDQRKIDGQIDIATKAMADVGKLLTRLLADTRAALNAEQRAKLDELRSRPGKRGAGRGFGAL
ncbi:MAG: hypothetical protein DRI90_02370, partial [Deltaproteobacteria bacterium]